MAWDSFTKLSFSNTFSPLRRGKEGAREVVEPLVDKEKLVLDSADFFRTMRQLAPIVKEEHEILVARAEAQKKGSYSGPSATTTLWRRLSERKEVCALFPEHVKVAKISFTLIGTSVRNEQDFSMLDWVKDDPRGSLTTHLEACLRVALSKSLYPDLDTYPYDEVIAEFVGGDVQRRLLGAAAEPHA